MLDSEKDRKHILHQEDRDMFVMQVPDDEADDEERNIDNDVVHNLVEKSKPDREQAHRITEQSVNPNSVGIETWVLKTQAPGKPGNFAKPNTRV